MGQQTSRVPGLRRALRENRPGLKEVELRDLQLSNKAVRKIAEALRKNDVVWHLALSGCEVNIPGLQYLSDLLCSSSHISNIRKLNLSNNKNIGCAGAACVAGILKSNQVLEYLSLNNCDIGDEGTQSLANVLSQNSTLLTLHLGTNGLTDAGAQQVGYMLKINVTLEGLSLWQNNISLQGAQWLAEGLQVNHRLRWLGLGSNCIGAEGTGALCQALLHNTCLLWLGLGGNEIGDQGALHLATMLQSKVSCLQSIGLGGNDIHDEGVLHLASALRFNTHLHSLGLGGNKIADEGGRALAEMLELNQKLGKLLLSSNLLGDSGVSCLAAGLAVNTGLRTLLLADNPFGDEGGLQLARTLCHRNRSLQVLDIHETSMSRATEREVVEQLRQHSVLRKLGSVFGDHTSQYAAVIGRLGQASEEVRHQQEEHFRQQAPSAIHTSHLTLPQQQQALLTSQLSPSHLY